MFVYVYEISNNLILDRALTRVDTVAVFVAIFEQASCCSSELLRFSTKV
jgi:hypothetical protein